MRFDFDAATAVRDLGDGRRFAAALHPLMAIAGKAHGGYLLAVLARAAEAVGDHPHPIATTAQYLRTPDSGDAEVHVDGIRVGRSVSQVRARLVQGGADCVEALITMGRLDPTSEPFWTDQPPVDLPPFESLQRNVAESAADPRSRISILEVVDQRLDPAVMGFMVGKPSGQAEMRGWLGFADGRDVDPFGLLFMADALPPVTFELGLLGWVPTFQLTAYVRAVPAAGPLRCRQSARLVEAGRLDESCDVWDSRGRLVAQAVQLAGARIPPIER